MLMYCKKCGRLIQDSKKCDICDSVTYQVPTQYLMKDVDFLIDSKLEDQFIEECVKSSPEFDEYLFNNRDRIKAQKFAEYERDMAIGDAIRQGQMLKLLFVMVVRTCQNVLPVAV